MLIQILKFSKFHCEQYLRTITSEKISYLDFNQSNQSIYTFLKKAKHLLSAKCTKQYKFELYCASKIHICICMNLHVIKYMTNVII